MKQRKAHVSLSGPSSLATCSHGCAWRPHSIADRSDPARIAVGRRLAGSVSACDHSGGALYALRHQRILEIGPDNTVAAESKQDYAAWKTEREDLLSEALQPSISVQTVTALARARAPQHPEPRPSIQSRPSSGGTVSATDWPTFSELLSIRCWQRSTRRRRGYSTGVGRGQWEASSANDLSTSSTVCTRQ
jgi:hypothetical protein